MEPWNRTLWLVSKMKLRDKISRFELQDATPSWNFNVELQDRILVWNFGMKHQGGTLKLELRGESTGRNFKIEFQGLNFRTVEVQDATSCWNLAWDSKIKFGGGTSE